MAVQRLNLGLTAPADGCGGDACACGASGIPTRAHDATAATEIGVSGMTCDHCVRAVTDEISAIEGVTGVEVDLVAGGTSRVRVVGQATPEQLRSAIAEAGYAMAL